jgi:Kef-type K+ transport system membrane component KefB
MLFFLFVAGLEVNLSDFKRLGRRATLIGLVGTLVPISAGVGLVYLIPRDFWGPLAGTHFLAFALFIGMNFANSANPVIARILMDLGLLKGEIGTLIMTATIVDDLVNWTLFAIILSNLRPPVGQGHQFASYYFNDGDILRSRPGHRTTVGARALHWTRSHLSWPTGFIALTILIILVAGSITEDWAFRVLGAFLVNGAEATMKKRMKLTT